MLHFIKIECILLTVLRKRRHQEVSINIFKKVLKKVLTTTGKYDKINIVTQQKRCKVRHKKGCKYQIKKMSKKVLTINLKFDILLMHWSKDLAKTIFEN